MIFATGVPVKVLYGSLSPIFLRELNQPIRMGEKEASGAAGAATS